MEEKLSKDERRDPIDLETIIVRRETESPFENFFLLRIVFFDDKKTRCYMPLSDRNSFAFLPFFIEFEKIVTFLAGSAHG